MKQTKQFLFNWRNLLPLGLVGIFIFIAVAAPILAPSADPSNPIPFKLVESKDPNPLPPGPGIPLGTTVYHPDVQMLLHYDVYHSLIWGSRDALRFGLLVALISAVFGVLIGAVSGYIGGLFNVTVMRITDAFLAFPLIAGVWLFQQFLESINYLNTMYPNLDAIYFPASPRDRFLAFVGLDPVLLAFILFSWMPFARLINGNILKLKNTEFIVAAHTLGAKPGRIIIRHLLPNAIAPTIVVLARDIGGMVIMQAAFNFVGIGASITGGIAEWNRLLVLGRTWIIGVGGNLLTYWWMYIPPTLILILFGVSWNLLGDRLNAILNPWEN